jgi:hypothetical protein
MNTKDKELERIKELIQKTGLDASVLHKVGEGEYVLTVEGGYCKERELHELGLTVTSIHNSEYAKDMLDMVLSMKEGAKSIWYPPTHEERLWIDCTVYQDLENDAAHCMSSTSDGLIDKKIEYLKRLQRNGYTKFYQAVGYMGLSGKYDENNCLSTCILCKQGLLASNKKIGDAPIPMIYVDGTIGIKTSPAVVYVICHNCYRKYYEGIPMNMIRKEINFMLYSQDTRWIKANRIIRSPI